MRKRRKRKTKVRFHYFKSLKCQGRKELRYLKEQDRYNKPLPTKAKRVKTPYSYYTPDFEYPDRYIEVKSLGTWFACIGLKAYKGIGEPSDLQWRKIKFCAKNIKPIEIVIYLSPRDKIPTLDIVEENITIKIKGGYKPKKPNK